MDLRLRERAYLVTGGSRGLGFAAAQALIEEGARVMLSAPHGATASAAAARLAVTAGADPTRPDPIPLEPTRPALSPGSPPTTAIPPPRLV